MRKRFEQQCKIGFLSIADTPVSKKSRDDFPAVVAALKEIYLTPEYNNKVFNLLEDKILKEKKSNGKTRNESVANFCFSTSLSWTKKP